MPVPPLSPAELRRLFLRLPALRDLDAEDRRLLTRTIGGHPRLIEFTDALLRGGRASLRHVQVKLRDLARAEGIDLRRDRPLRPGARSGDGAGQRRHPAHRTARPAHPRQAAILRQVAVCRAPMTLDDLAFTLTPSRRSRQPAPRGSPPDLAALRADVDRLADLTLLTPGDGIVMHPWTADLVTRNTRDDLHRPA